MRYDHNANYDFVILCFQSICAQVRNLLATSQGAVLPETFEQVRSSLQVTINQLSLMNTFLSVENPPSSVEEVCDDSAAQLKVVFKHWTSLGA